MNRHTTFVSSFLAVMVVTTSAEMHSAERPLSRPPASTIRTANADPALSAPFFDDSVLHEVRLDINARDWEALKVDYLSNTYYPCDFRWGSLVVRNISIRSRGTASRSGVKPGLRVDFNRYAADQTFLGLTSFVLRNNTTDRTSMHERISMQMFERMGIPAPREAFTKLFVNGEYVGLYSIVESPDKNFLWRTRNENAGYLYKFDRNVGDAPYYMTYSGSDPDIYVPHPFKPETHESDPHPEPIEEMLRIVNEASDENFRDAIAPYVDLNAFIRHVAVEMFLNESDGVLGDYGTTNFYLYRPPNSTQHVYIPWDKSETMHDRALSIFHNIDDVPEQTQNRLMTRAWKYRDLRNLYLDVLDAVADSAAQAADGDGRGWIEREVDREFAQIRDAVLADPKKPFTNDEFLQSVDDLKKFAQDRPSFVKISVANKR